MGIWDRVQWNPVFFFSITSIVSLVSSQDSFPDCAASGWLMGEDQFFFNSSVGIGFISGADPTSQYGYVGWANTAFCQAAHPHAQMALVSSDANVQFFVDVLKPRLNLTNTTLSNEAPYIGLINRVTEANFVCPFFQDKNLCWAWIDGTSAVPSKVGSYSAFAWTTSADSICAEHWHDVANINGCEEPADPAACSVSGNHHQSPPLPLI
jgi:hypothetical protein